MCAGTGPINTWNRAAYMHVGKDGNPTDVPEWTHISQNFIMNGPTIGHTSSLFPFVDNDDGKCKQSPCITVLARQGTTTAVAMSVRSRAGLGSGSAYFSIVGNVGIYGGGKVRAYLCYSNASPSQTMPVCVDGTGLTTPAAPFCYLFYFYNGVPFVVLLMRCSATLRTI